MKALRKWVADNPAESLSDCRSAHPNVMPHRAKRAFKNVRRQMAREQSPSSFMLLSAIMVTQVSLILRSSLSPSLSRSLAGSLAVSLCLFSISIFLFLYYSIYHFLFHFYLPLSSTFTHTPTTYHPKGRARSSKGAEGRC
jgi:hypothetical protein